MFTIWVRTSPSRRGKSVRTRQAVLEFVYGGVVVPGNTLGEERQVQGGTVFKVIRDGAAEAQHRHTLRALKLGVDWDTQVKGAHRLVMQGEGRESLFWASFLSEKVPDLQRQGWEILTDPGFLTATSEVQWHADVRSVKDHFTLDLTLLVDGEEVDLLSLLTELLSSPAANLRRWLDGDSPAPFTLELGFGQQLQVTDTLKSTLRVLLEYQQGKPGPVALPLLEAGVLQDLDGAVQPRWSGREAVTRDSILFEGLQRGWQDRGPLQLPLGLQGTLRPYQAEGVRWLQFLREHGLGGVLADDMGLGKTLQVLTHLLIEKEAGRLKKPALIVMPTSLLHNWLSEVEKFTPGLRTLTLHGPQRHRDFWQVRDVDVVFTTYPLLGKDGGELGQFSYHAIVLDEAQNIKNHQTQASTHLQLLEAQHRICLTGTPMENHLGELWSLFRFLMPELLPESRLFNQMYRTPIEKHQSTVLKDRLRGLLSPFVLRRKKENVARELPEKTEVVVHLDMEGGQQKLYDALRIAVHRDVQAEVERQGLARSHIHILDALVKLRQVCCDPALVKLDLAREVKGSVKREWIRSTLPDMLEEGRTVLIFSQFTSMLGLLEETLRELQVPYSLLTGQTRNRQEQIQRFQAGEVKVFLISLKAGGVGLNLTAADTVIHYDPWWNPAVENQATDRAHRIGQEKPVFVYKLITSGTLEEKILSMQARKAALFQSILEGTGEAGLNFTWEDYRTLFE